MKTTQITKMSRIRLLIAAAGLAIATAAVGATVPAAAHNLFEPASSTFVAPAPVHLLPIVTTHSDGAPTTPTATLV
jgi:hypothetical protein